MEQTAADHPSRRTVLSAGVVLAGAGAATLAGCSPSKKSDSSSTSSAAAAGTASAAGPVVLAAVSAVPVGNALSVTYQGKPALVSQPTAGEIVAFSAICTHQGCTVAPAGKQFHCPCHGSVYDAATGAVITGPAPAPLPSIPVHVDGANVVAGA
jgi:Rieske Fe-S protein